MSSRISTAKLKVSAEGTKGVAQQLDQVGKATERVGRAQTRLGQASASAGRQFSAQASGLGGLVAAYAGAAATVFALQAAFDALNKSARAETIVQGTKALALEIGQSGPRILKEIKSITQGQIELSEAAQNINIALSAGFNTDQISRLTKVSLGASRALGRNLTDALQRVVRGAAKLEPELLDELGIFTRIDPAVNKYAQRLGIAASNLTDFERRQAFVNAVITEGERKFSAIDVSSKSTQKSLEQLQTQIQELGLRFGQLLANTLVPLIDFFKNNAGNTLLLFGGILALVFGKATEIVGNFAKNSLNNISDWANNYASAAAKSKGATEVIIQGQKELQATIAKNKRGLGGDAAFTRGLTRDLSSAAAEARRRFISGEEVDSRQRAKDVEVLTKAQKDLTAAGRGQSAAFNDATKIINTYENAQKKAGGRAQALTKISIGLQSAIRGVATVAAFAGKVFNTLLFGFGALQLAFSFFGIDILDKLKGAFTDNSQAAADLESGIKGLATAAAGGGAALTNAIKDIKNDEKTLESIGDKIEELYERIENERIKKDPVSKRVLLELDFEIVALNEIEALTKRVNKERAKGAKADQEYIDAKAIEITLLNALVDAAQKYGFENTRIVGQLSRLTGLPLDKVPEAFAEGALGVEKLNGNLKIAGIEIQKIGNQYTLDGLTDQQKEAVEANTIFNAVLKETNEAFSAGALNSDKLSAKIAGLGAQFLKVRDQGKATVDELARFTSELDRLRAQQVELKALETITIGISKAFGTAFTALDTAPFKGLVDLSGNLSKNSEQAKFNQAEFLNSIIKTNQEAADLVKSLEPGEVIDPIIQERAQNFNSAVKAAAGSILEYYQTAQKVVETEKVKSQQLAKQLQSLKDQAEIQKLQRDNTLATENEKQLRDAAKARFDQAEKSLELNRLTFDLKQKEIAAEQKIASAIAQNASARLKIDQLNRQTIANSKEAARQLNQGILENQLAILEERSFKDQTQINAKKREIIELERQYADERFAEQKALVEKELSDSLELLRVQEDLEKSRLAQLEEEKTALEQFNKDQLALFDRQSALETQKLTDQKAQLERERNIANLRADAQVSAIEADEKIFAQQSQQTLAQLEGYKNFADTVNTFVSATGPDSPFVQAIAKILDVAQDGAGSELTDNLAKIPQVTTKALEDAIAVTMGNIGTQGEIFGQQKSNIQTQAAGESALNIIRQTGIDDQIANYEKLRVIERDILTQTLAGKAKELDAEIRLQQTKLDAIPLQELELRAQATQKIEQLEQTRIQTLEQLNQRVDTLARSEDRLALALDQSQSIVKENLTGAFMKLNDALIDGSITMDMVGNTFKDMVGNMLREIQQAVFRKTIVDPLTDVITGSIGGLFTGGLTGGPTIPAGPTIAVAQGGRVHMAGGGMKRDRVPAMLEPGEFVMRKEAVKEAGLGTMMRLNAAPQQMALGGVARAAGGARGSMAMGVADRGDVYDFNRAQQISRDFGIPMDKAIGIAQDEAARSGGSKGQFSYSNNSLRGMRPSPSTSKPVTGQQALDAINNMLQQRTQTPTLDQQSSLNQQSGIMKVADLTDIFGGSRYKNTPTRSKSKSGLFSRITPKALTDRMQTRGGQQKKGTTGFGDLVSGLFKQTSSNVANSVKGFYDGASVIDDQGNVISRGPAPAPVMNDLLPESTLALGNSLIGVEGLTPEEALDVAKTYSKSKEKFDPRGPLDKVLGAKGIQFDMGGIPIIGTAINLGRMITGNNALGRIQIAPKTIPTAAQARARVDVFNRTGQMATGNRLGYMPGDVTPSGNFMAPGNRGIVSNVDPYALDKIGVFGGNLQGRGFRKDGTGVEYSSIDDFLNATIKDPTSMFQTGKFSDGFGVRDTRLTRAEYNAMSESGRMSYEPSLRGGRAINAYQQAQLETYGGYSRIGGGYTIPGGRFSGRIGAPSQGLVDSIQNYQNLRDSGFFDSFANEAGRTRDAGGALTDVTKSGESAGFSNYGNYSDDYGGYEDDFASGGLIRLKKYAAGGAVMSRDRVPALLEPGEFVIRRPMAKAIGGPALNQMNATGKNLTPPNIQVNLKNEGMQKTAQAQPARVQGDKIIIDMITRDLRNNGPIKKSLRK